MCGQGMKLNSRRRGCAPRPYAGWFIKLYDKAASIKDSLHPSWAEIFEFERVGRMWTSPTQKVRHSARGDARLGRLSGRAVPPALFAIRNIYKYRDCSNITRS